LKEWQPARCIVGLPRHPDGAEHEMTVRCRRFAHQLQGRYGVATVLVDERYSSAVIPQKRGEAIDAQAAAIILQQYFDEPAES
jgi:putative Holliday junction resolvase